MREGQIFNGKFRIERFIGEGAMGLVVEATNLGLDERVALKFLRREALSQPEIVARFRREARASVKIKSDHVAKVFDVGDAEDGTPFIVMEFLSGSDLSQMIQLRKRLEFDEVADYIIQACEGIAEAHARGIIHRDIKPENLFLAQGAGARKQIKVLDFGISKAALGAGALDVDLASHHTTQIMGSPHYMSPEQLRSTRDVDARADIWSLGVVLFELLTGDTPFTSGEVTGLIAEILHDPHQRLTTVRPELPVGLEAVIDRCLAKDPKQRFQGAAELAVALLPFAPKRARASVERTLDIARSGGGATVVEIDSIPPPPPGASEGMPTPGSIPAAKRNATSETALGAAIPVAEASPRRRGGLLWLLAAVLLLAGVALVVRMMGGDARPRPVADVPS
ncbi:MAG TPA: serine/threonine-protein kinase, partial [Labilithrix sp.]|nr:serine/threonine-protein kinase [Labilithrix sp.]